MDHDNDIYYLSREGTPFDSSTPNFISSYSQILAISREDFERNEGGWHVIYNVEQKDTGFGRNHNAGIFKDSYGWLYSHQTLPVGITVSDVMEKDFLWSYRIHYMEIKL